MTDLSFQPRATPLWARAMANPADFAAEQAKLGQVWTFLGLDSDIPKLNDWFRTSLGARSIFVQRFSGGIRAFENRCAHRFFPLRTADRGNGPVVCGFHHWRYNDDGLALGIPQCVENFGMTPRAMDARLPEVEIAQCGPMIFGRFPGGAGEGLDEWLGPGRDIILHLMRDPGRVMRTSSIVATHWKNLYAISLDDYHVVAIHPTSFGKDGYIPLEITRYFRFGAHSAYFTGADAGAFEAMLEECRKGTYHPRRYRIFQFFPNLVVVLIYAVTVLGDAQWYLLIQDVVALAHDRTRSTTHFFRLPFATPTSNPWRKALRRALWPGTTAGVWISMRKIQREDEIACETLQSAAALVDGPPRLARQEARIGWFEEEYARALGEAGLPPGPEPAGMSGS